MSMSLSELIDHDSGNNYLLITSLRVTDGVYCQETFEGTEAQWAAIQFSGNTGEVLIYSKPITFEQYETLSLYI